MHAHLQPVLKPFIYICQPVLTSSDRAEEVCVQVTHTSVLQNTKQPSFKPLQKVNHPKPRFLTHWLFSEKKDRFLPYYFLISEAKMGLGEILFHVNFFLIILCEKS